MLLDGARKLAAIEATISSRVTRPLRSLRRTQVRLSKPLHKPAHRPDDAEVSSQLSTPPAELEPRSLAGWYRPLPHCNRSRPSPPQPMALIPSTLGRCSSGRSESSNVPTRAKAWLALVAADGAYPDKLSLDRTARRLRMEGPSAVGDEVVRRFGEAATRGRRSTAGLQVVDHGVVVDVSHTVSHDLHTGIQRVAARRCSRWLGAGRPVSLVHFDASAMCPRLLSVGESKRSVVARTPQHLRLGHRAAGAEGGVRRCARAVARSPDSARARRRAPPSRVDPRAGLRRRPRVARTHRLRLDPDDGRGDRHRRDDRELRPVPRHGEARGPGRSHQPGNGASTSEPSRRWRRRRACPDQRSSRSSSPPKCPSSVAMRSSGPARRWASAPRPSSSWSGATSLQEPPRCPRGRRAHVGAGRRVRPAHDRWQRLEERGVRRGRRTAPRGGPVLNVRKRSTETELWAAYRLARFSVFPSLLEGFGLPVAESLASGTPVITSGFGSMAEIAERGGSVLVDPLDIDALEREMSRLLKDDDVPAKLRDKHALARPSRGNATPTTSGGSSPRPTPDDAGGDGPAHMDGAAASRPARQARRNA